MANPDPVFEDHAETFAGSAQPEQRLGGVPACQSGKLRARMWTWVGEQTHTGPRLKTCYLKLMSQMMAEAPRTGATYGPHAIVVERRALEEGIRPDRWGPRLSHVTRRVWS